MAYKMLNICHLLMIKIGQQIGTNMPKWRITVRKNAKKA